MFKKMICAIPGPSRTVGFTSVYAFFLAFLSSAHFFLSEVVLIYLRFPLQSRMGRRSVLKTISVLPGQSASALFMVFSEQLFHLHVYFVSEIALIYHRFTFAVQTGKKKCIKK